MPADPAQSALQAFVDQADGEVLVLHDETAARSVRGLTAAGLAVRHLDGDLPEPRTRWSAVLVAVADAGALRRLVSVLPALGRTRRVACLVVEASQPLMLLPRAEWPPIAAVNARRLPSGDMLTVLRWTRPLAAHVVLEELARASSPARGGNGGLFVATTLRDSTRAAVADPGVLVLPSAVDGSDPARDVPPDVILASGPVSDLPVHPVTGRRATVITDPDLVNGPLDEGVLNPTGFVQRPEHGLVSLSADADSRLRLRASDSDLDLDLAQGVTAPVVALLRAYAGVTVPRIGSSSSLLRSVAALGMAGVPVTVADLDPRAAIALGSDLAAALTTPVDLSSPLRREEHSVRLRRAALLGHSSLAWRARLAARAGLPYRSFPTCSIVLATKRKDQLAFALRQVARQRGADLELVVVTHGFSPDAAQVADLAGHPTTLITMPAEAYFGEVLNAGVAAASGDLVLKMDDDDWYGRDHVADLLLARHYSGADLVGMTVEFVYLHEQDVTLRRAVASERTVRFVIGGTMMIERARLNELGGFRRSHRYVDASLLASVHAAGGSVYRTHGLGYMLARRPSGHTWEASDNYLHGPERQIERWTGFAPSHLLDPDEADLPG